MCSNKAGLEPRTGGAAWRGIRSDHPAPALRVAVAFAVGTLVPVGTLLVGFPLVGAAGGFLGSSVGRPLAALVVACVAGGQYAGGALGGGWRARIAFGAAFLVGLPIPLVVVSGLAALSGHERVSDLAWGFAPGFGIGFGLLGVVGGILCRAHWRETVQAAGVLVAAGVIGALTLAGVVALVASTSSPAAPVARVCGAAFACAAPAAIGGWRFTRLRRRPTGAPRRRHPGASGSAQE